MIKILLLISLFCTSGYLGYNISQTFIKKQQFYQDLLSFCQSLKTEISFLKTDLISIFEKYEYKSKFNEVLNDIQQNLKNQNNINFEEIFEKYGFLNEQDKILLKNIFIELGQLGYDEQLERLSFFINEAERVLLNTKEKNTKIVPLCKKMGFLIGGLVCIVLI